MAITIADFRTRFPEFSDNAQYPDARVQLFLDDAVAILGSDEGHWDGNYDRAQAYITGHMLVIASETEGGSSSSKSGPITSTSAGGVSVNRNASQHSRSEIDDFFMTTSYGQQYITIRNMTFVGVLTATQ